MTALARWCLRRRLVVVLMWCAVLVGVGTSAVLAGSSYSEQYGVPATESGRANTLISQGFPDRGGDSDTIVWKTGSAADTGPGNDSVKDAEVEQRMDRALDDIKALPGVGSVSSPYAGGDGSAGSSSGSGSGSGSESGSSGHQQHEDRISKDGRTAYATVTFDAPYEELEKKDVQAVVDTAQRAGDDVRGLHVELGGPGVALTEAPGGHLSEIVGIARRGRRAASSPSARSPRCCCRSPPRWSASARPTLAIGLLSHVMTVADFAPMLGTADRPRRRHRLRAVHRHPAPRGPERGAARRRGGQRAVATAGRAVVFAGATVCIALLGMLVLRLSFLNGVAIAASLTVVLDRARRP